MKKTALFIVVLLLAGVSFSQKAKIKDDIASVDGTPFLKWEKRGPGEYSVSGINSTEEEIYVMYLDYNDPSKATKSNPEGTVRWVELNFLTLQKKCEVLHRFPSGIVEFIYENSIYVEGVLNAENVDKLVSKYGMRYSESRPGGNINIYINE